MEVTFSSSSPIPHPPSVLSQRHIEPITSSKTPLDFLHNFSSFFPTLQSRELVYEIFDHTVLAEFYCPQRPLDDECLSQMIVDLSLNNTHFLSRMFRVMLLTPPSLTCNPTPLEMDGREKGDYYSNVTSLDLENEALDSPLAKRLFSHLTHLQSKNNLQSLMNDTASAVIEALNQRVSENPELRHVLKRALKPLNVKVFSEKTVTPSRPPSTLRKIVGLAIYACGSLIAASHARD